MKRRKGLIEEPCAREPRREGGRESDAAHREPEPCLRAARRDREEEREGQRDDAEREGRVVGGIALRDREPPEPAGENARGIAEDLREGRLEEAERMEADRREFGPREATDAARGEERGFPDFEKPRRHEGGRDEAAPEERGRPPGALRRRSAERECKREEQREGPEGRFAAEDEQGRRENHEETRPEDGGPAFRGPGAGDGEE